LLQSGCRHCPYGYDKKRKYKKVEIIKSYSVTNQLSNKNG
jgi:hypothetical protein